MTENSYTLQTFPNISVVTVVFNRVDTIGAAIDSVVQQTRPAFEHVVQDGGSNDGTLEVIRARARDEMSLVSASDRGIYDAINKGIGRAKGDVIGLMHSDDAFANPQALQWISQAFEADVDGVYGDLEYVSAEDPNRVVRYWRAGAYSRSKLARGWMPPHPTLYLKRDVFERFGDYDTDFRISADYEAMLRYLTRGQIKLAYVPRVLVRMRLGGMSNGSVSNLIAKSREDYRAIRRHDVGGLGTLFLKNFSKVTQFVQRGR